MSAAFTPGPWWIDEDRSDEYEGVLIVGPRADATRYGVKGEWEIAAVRADWDHDEYLDSDVVGLIAEANARLIAAAPELYEALQRICAAFPDDAPALIEARRVLAKARGESDQ